MRLKEAMILGMPRRIFLDLLAHSLVTLIFCGIVFSKTDSLFYVMLLISGEILIDLDHLIDYFVCFKHKFNLSDFLSGTYLQSGRVYIFFHSWEITLLILLFGLWFKSAGLIILSLSLAVHLLIDNFQKKSLWIYSLAYRIAKKFDAEILLPGDPRITKNPLIP